MLPLNTDHVFWGWLLTTTLQAVPVVLLIVLIHMIVRSKVRAKWLYALWFVLIVKLVWPISLPSKISVFNALPGRSQAVASPGKSDDVDDNKISANTLSPATALPANPAQPDSTTKPAHPLQSLQTIQPINTDKTAKPAEWAKKTETAKPTLSEQTAGTSQTSLSEVEVKGQKYEAVFTFVALAGMVGCLGYILIGYARLFAAIRGLRPKGGQEILEVLAECRERMGVRTSLTIVESRKVSCPVLLGMLRPRLVFPEGLLETISRKQLRHILLHELAHLKRGDILVGWLTALLQCLHWFNPIIWYAFYRMRADRELACDERALTVLEEEPSEYGHTIVSLLERYARPGYVPAMAGLLEDIPCRVESSWQGHV